MKRLLIFLFLVVGAITGSAQVITGSTTWTGAVLSAPSAPALTGSETMPIIIGTSTKRTTAQAIANLGGTTYTGTNGVSVSGSTVLLATGGVRRSGTNGDQYYLPTTGTNMDQQRGKALMQAVLDWQPNEKLFLFSGTYEVTTTLRTRSDGYQRTLILAGNGNGETLQGSGMDATTIRLGNSAGTLASASIVDFYLLVSLAYGANHVTVSDITFDGNVESPNQINKSIQAITIFGSDAVIERCRFIHFGSNYTGVETFTANISTSGADPWFGNIYNATIRDCIFETPANVTWPGGQGLNPFVIGGQNLSPQTLTNPPVWNTILSSATSGTTTVITTLVPHLLTAATGTNGAATHDITIRGTNVSTLNARWRPTILTGTTFSVPITTGSNATNGQEIEESGWVFGAKILNCTVRNIGTSSNSPPYVHGANFAYVCDGEVAGCTFQNLTNVGTGIYQDTGSLRRVRYHDNIFSDCSDPLIINIDSGAGNTVNDVTIDHNTIKSTAASTNNPIIVSSQVTSGSNLVIRDNVIHASNGLQIPISIIRMNNVSIENNLIEGGTSTFYSLLSSTNISIVNNRSANAAPAVGWTGSNGVLYLGGTGGIVARSGTGTQTVPGISGTFAMLSDATTYTGGTNITVNGSVVNLSSTNGTGEPVLRQSGVITNGTFSGTLLSAVHMETATLIGGISASQSFQSPTFTDTLKFTGTNYRGSGALVSGSTFISTPVVTGSTYILLTDTSPPNYNPATLSVPSTAMKSGTGFAVIGHVASAVSGSSTFIYELHTR